jgi:hypothetical protein
MRSSSYANFDFCQQQYYMTYVLGLTRETSKKAAMGTSVHKVLECLANIKKQFDATGCDIIDFHDKELGGVVSIDKNKWLEPYTLTNIEVDQINRTRINKQTYIDDAKLSYGHTRYGIEFIAKLIDLSTKHYAENWNPVDYKDVTNFVWMTLDYNNGMFDPRRRKIVDAEPHFDILIDRPWAAYDWTLPNGEKISGKLGIKGTIDLITEVGDGIIEIVDWKTGQRIDWASRKDNDIKTYEKLCQDFQLMLYYYAAHYLYPKAKQIIVTIFYVRHGGPFTVCFDDNTLAKVEHRLKQRFHEIKNCEAPELLDPYHQSFKCKYICDYFKKKSPDGKQCMCDFIHDEILRYGIETTTAMHMNPNFNIGTYEAPGEA